MKILVKSRYFIEHNIELAMSYGDVFYTKGNFISIFSTNSYSPLPDRFNILKLNFDDVTDYDFNTSNKDNLTFFNNDIAEEIKTFVNSINSNKILYIHCDAGISRSGAVGYILNEYFNKYKKLNSVDNDYFIKNNSHIQPNSLVVRILKLVMFGKTDYSAVWKDVAYNQNNNE